MTKKWWASLPALLALASMLVNAAMTDLTGLNVYIVLVNTSTVLWAETLEEEINAKT